ncbi:MAG: type V CRISPR-associated protein Cas12k [Crinalium sp.]
MSQVTIQCRLIASQPTRQQLWTLMAKLNTPLINELLRQMPQHPEFETWRQQGKLPIDIVTKLCEPLKSDPRYIGQPARFYTSAIALVKYIYKSWFKLQQRLERRLKGQKRWLEMLKSDAELVEQSSCSLEDIRIQAIAILTSHKPQNQTPQPALQRKKRQKSKKDKSLLDNLYDTYDQTQDILTRSVICYLLKNGCKIPTKPEDAEKIPKSRRKAEIKIARILDQLNGRTPSCRDLTGEKWLETLLTATITAPKE